MGCPRSASKKLFTHPERKTMDLMHSTQSGFNCILLSGRSVYQIIGRSGVLRYLFGRFRRYYLQKIL